ncbi:hypothetical protein QWM81_19695 [Streptomyces ficellus]|uniref:MarR family transcriptional regulator n=1 Tax=Streptomyces ficellus TaxID=1977088 RepID=A0ABT7Z9S5_9ACTN|nr:hypothetical protein [Streptomyces ficellus]MDN3296244.1 hypothetical protein [Streptomyces ficellus]
MADAELSAAEHPLANPGYGKRSAPGQKPATAHDFDHLPPREASIAGYIDRLDEGADISYKTLAKFIPAYGQCAIRTALNNLVRAGHLRRGLEHTAGSGSQHWVTRTWWSRTARDDEWWAAFQRGDVPEDKPRRQTRSRAFILLAALGREEPMMSLSAQDCTALEPLVSEWFERGADERHIMHALTAGLPQQVHRPVALARTRLTTKIPPERTEPYRPPLRVLECATCGDPARPEALLSGECAPCRGEPVPVPRSTLAPDEVRARAAEARAAATRRPERSHT